eukprot:303980-Chlamydomonas_euryale.AAC.24
MVSAPAVAPALDERTRAARPHRSQASEPREPPFRPTFVPSEIRVLHRRLAAVQLGSCGSTCAGR